MPLEPFGKVKMLVHSRIPLLLSLCLAAVSGSVVQAQTITPRVAWYGRLADGLAEAKRSNRPILLLSAAPQCEGVPGIW